MPNPMRSKKTATQRLRVLKKPQNGSVDVKQQKTSTPLTSTGDSPDFKTDSPLQDVDNPSKSVSPLRLSEGKCVATSILDIVDKDSHLRQSSFWGFGKLFIILALWYTVATTASRVYNQKGPIDLALFESLRECTIDVFILWIFCFVWSHNAYFNASLFILRWDLKNVSWIYQLTSQALLLLVVYSAVWIWNLGVISSGILGLVAMTHYMKMHSYVETVRDAKTNGGMELKQHTEKASFFNFMDFLFVPSCVYETNFPREPRKFKRALIRIGLLALTMIVMYVYFTEVYIPIAASHHKVSFIEAVTQLIVPTFVTAMLVFFVLFEGACNIFADLSGFADRSFYDDWWNSTTFEEFNRKWNRIVYKWLVKHVYLSARLKYGFSKTKSRAITFAVSSIFHEMILAIVFKRGNIKFLSIMLLQIPIITIQSAIIGHAHWGNYIFWLFLMLGLSFSVTLYTRSWAQLNAEENSLIGWLE